MGLWRDYFHWTVLLNWVVLAVTVPTILAIAGLFLFFDQYGGANVCFIIASLFIFAKIAHLAVVTNDDVFQRVLFTFILFGLVGICLVETLRGVNHWAATRDKIAEGQSKENQSNESYEIKRERAEISDLKLDIDRVVPLWGIKVPNQPVTDENRDMYIAVVGKIINQTDVQASAEYWEIHVRFADGKSMTAELLVPPDPLIIQHPPDKPPELIRGQDYWPRKLDMKTIPAHGISYGFVFGRLTGVTRKQFNAVGTEVILCFKNSYGKRFCDTLTAKTEKIESQKKAPQHTQQPAKPEIDAIFVDATSPGIAVTNLTADVVMREPMLTISAWNFDTKINLPEFTHTEKERFVKKGSAVIIGSFDNPRMKPLIKVGDHILGLVMVDCPDCSMARYYWVFFVYGGESWYSPIPIGTTINIVEIAQHISAANWDVDEFMKLVPHGDRLVPRKP